METNNSNMGNDEKITLDEPEIEEFFNRGSKHLNLQSEAVKEYGEQTINIYFKSVDLAAGVIATLGIIAGFGFTAFGYIQSELLFFAGEVILIGAIIYDVGWIKTLYKGEFESLAKSRKHRNDAFKNWTEQYKKIATELTHSKTTSKNDLELLQKRNNEILDVFSASPKTEEKEREIFPNKIYVALIVGSALLLLSFFIHSLIYSIVF